MYFNTVHINCSLIGSELPGTTYGTMIFAVAATYTYAFIDHGAHMSVVGLDH